MPSEGSSSRIILGGLHGHIFYLAIRKFIYETPIPPDLDAIVRDAVQTFMDGAKTTMPKLLVSG
ncbi:hypothetical protein GA0061098_101418 [Bradyrhizobium shewense]|uniref:Uncharacterized protein n=1 Tax=Bradyrhizobium shewense TaxID=1761772 RepID=A0A1C3XBT8_9BRAD|nr:hypothetical protein GA0061098_101418 [Bradyrhizobium shewense]